MYKQIILVHLLLKKQLFKSAIIDIPSPFPKRQTLDSSRLNRFADDNLRFDANARNFSKMVENTVGKGEIARYEQFLLFPHCFQKTCIFFLLFTRYFQKTAIVFKRSYNTTAEKL